MLPAPFDNFCKNLSEIDSFVSSNLHPFGSHSIVLRKKDSKFRITGFLSDFAGYRTLNNFLTENIDLKENLSRNFIEKLKNIAISLNQVHNNGFLHRDISMSNILVTFVSRDDQTLEYAFKLSDFGLACKKNFRWGLSIYPGYRKGIRYPIELFYTNMYHMIDERSDWYQYGYLLFDVAQKLKTNQQQTFLGYFYPLIQELTRYDAPDRVWGFKEIIEYFDMILAESSSGLFVSNEKFVNYFHLESANNEEFTVEFLDSDETPFNILTSHKKDNGRILKSFYKVQQEGESDTQKVRKTNTTTSEIVPISTYALSYVRSKPEFFKFAEDFPHVVCGSITEFIPRYFYKGQIFAVSTKGNDSICQCEIFCGFDPEPKTSLCKKNMCAREVFEYFNREKEYVVPYYTKIN